MRGEKPERDFLLENLENKVNQIEQELKQTADIAIKTWHVSVGVDGKNGIRGSLNDLTLSVNKIKEDFLFLRETANNYNEIKSGIGKFLLGSSLAFIIQFAGVIWFFAVDHTEKEHLTHKIEAVIKDVENFKKDNQ
jgi:hypothetical protein